MSWSPFKKYYDCPACGKKEVAVESYTYPGMVVHKCEGFPLREVATVNKKGELTPLVVQAGDTKNRIVVRTRNFTVKQLLTTDEMVDCGKELNNAARDRSYADGCVQNPDHKIFEIRTNAHGQLKYLLMLDKRTIKDERWEYFSGYNLSQVPEDDGIEIIKSLINHGLLSKNPLPDLYPI